LLANFENMFVSMVRPRKNGLGSNFQACENCDFRRRKIDY
jgi:hypothetical protein